MPIFGAPPDHNRCIRMLGFWHLKRGFNHIVSFSAQECARKVCFYKPCTSAASESEFDHANRILRLNVGVLVYTVSRLSKCHGQLSIAFLFYGCFMDRFVVAKHTVKQTAQLFCPQKRKTLREDNSNVPETTPETLVFLTAPIRSRDHV